eukprot:gene181-177_t
MSTLFLKERTSHREVEKKLKEKVAAEKESTAMASWLSGLGSVSAAKELWNETAAQVKERTKVLKEKATETYVKTKEVAKQKLGRAETAAELQEILEQKARSANTLASIADLHRSWLAGLNRKDGPTYLLLLAEDGSEVAGASARQSKGSQDDLKNSNDGEELLVEESVSTSPAAEGVMSIDPNDLLGAPSPVEKTDSQSSVEAASHPTTASASKNVPKGAKPRYLTFKQVFLKSRALELSLEVILSDPWMRKRFGPPHQGDTSSHAFYLYSLLQNSLSCPVEIWSSLLRSAVDAEMLSDYHIRWLSRIFAKVLKLDWMDEVFHGERKDMAVRAEHLRNDIRGVKAALPSLSDADIEKQHRKKVGASRELVELYKGLRRNMEDALRHRQTTLAARDQSVTVLLGEMDEYKEDLSGNQVSTSAKRKELQEKLDQAATTLKTDLESMDAEREAIDKEIEELETSKAALKLEIEDVTQKLLGARTKQREFMTLQDSKRRVLYTEKDDFKQKISESEQTLTECESGREVLLQIQRIVRTTEQQVGSALNKQISELSKKRDQFDQHFVEVLRDHCRYEEDRLTSIGEICRVSCGKLVQLSEQDYDGQGRNAGADALARERHIFTKATADLEQVWADIVSFRTAHREFIELSTVLRDALQRMEEKCRFVKQQLAPGYELVVAAAPAAAPIVPEPQAASSPPPPPAATSPPAPPPPAAPAAAVAPVSAVPAPAVPAAEQAASPKAASPKAASPKAEVFSPPARAEPEKKAESPKAAAPVAETPAEPAAAPAPQEGGGKKGKKKGKKGTPSDSAEAPAAEAK